MDTDVALVIGINDYADDALPTLRGAVNDANYFEQWLLDPLGGDVPQANIVKLVSGEAVDQPRFDEIEDEIIRVVEKAKASAPNRIGRRLYLFMSGHGISVGVHEDCGLLSANASQVALHRSVPGLEVARRFRRSAAFEQVVLLMDCCRTVPLQDLGAPLPSLSLLATSDAQAAPLFRGLSAKWSQDSGERLLPVPGGPNGDDAYQGVFAHHVLEGLRSSGDENGNVTVAGLKKYVKAKIGPQAPDQTPDIEVDPPGTPENFVICSPGQATVTVHISVENPAIADFQIRSGVTMQSITTPLRFIGPGTWEVDLPIGLYLIGWPPGDPDQYLGYREHKVIGGGDAIIL